MTRAEAEARILVHAREIKKVLQEYYPQDDYFSITYCNGDLLFANTFYKHKDEGVIDYFEKGGGL